MDWNNAPYFHYEVINATYEDIVNAFGIPTNRDIDGKVQCEWEVNFNDQLFYIYDWKEYGIDVKTAESVEWHIGRADHTDIVGFTLMCKEKGLIITRQKF